MNPVQTPSGLAPTASPPSWHPLLRLTLRLLLLLLIAYLLLALLVFVMQRRLLFHPDPLPLRQAEAAGADSLALTAADGTELVAWWIKPPHEAATVVLYLHGNGANLDARAMRLRALRDDGHGVLALSWRGYGGSEGSPSESGFALDADAGWAELKRRGIAPQRVVVYGESLGSAHAVMLAARLPAGQRPAALLLDSAFDSTLALARARAGYNWLPLQLLMRDPHRADLAAAELQLPVLQVHCERDSVTPLSHARALQQAFGRKSELVVLPGNCHVPSYTRYRDLSRAWLSGTPQQRFATR